jgi:hypothetical protein
MLSASSRGQTNRCADSVAWAQRACGLTGHGVYESDADELKLLYPLTHRYWRAVESDRAADSSTPVESSARIPKIFLAEGLIWCSYSPGMTDAMADHSTGTGTRELGSLQRNLTRAMNSLATPFQRLAFIGSLRDSYTGRYLHEGWTEVASAEGIHAILARAHQEVFVTVLRLPIIHLAGELRYHFRLLQQPEQRTTVTWLEVEPFRQMVPLGCSASIRSLFISNIRIALELLDKDPDCVELEPVALVATHVDRPTPDSWLN